MISGSRAKEAFALRRNRTAAMIVAALFLAALPAGCATMKTPFPGRVINSSQFKAAVDSIAAPEAPSRGKAYVLTPGIKDMRDDDLEFRVLSRYAENALAQNGYRRVASDREADLLVRFGYGLGSPQVTTTTWTTSTGFAYPVGDLWFSVPARTSSTQANDYPVTVVLEAYDLKTQNRSPLWKTTVTGRSHVPNNVEGGIFVVSYYDIPEFRIQVPYLLAAASDHIGTDTGSTLHTVVRGDDPRVPAIMGKTGP
jgi:hypothetical protein